MEIEDLKSQNNQSIDGKQFCVLKVAQHVQAFLDRRAVHGTKCVTQVIYEKNMFGRSEVHESYTFCRFFKE